MSWLTPETIFRWVRAALVWFNRSVGIVARRLGQAQDSLTESLKQSLPPRARVKFLVAQRVAAKMLDLLLAGILGAVIFWPVGPLVGFLYSILGDGIHGMGFEGQSVGKKLMGLRVVRMPGGLPARLKDSAVRNLPVGVATFFAIIGFWGWIICILVGVPLMLIEITLMLRMDGETRLGDVMASTRVIEKR